MQDNQHSRKALVIVTNEKENAGCEGGLKWIEVSKVDVTNTV